MSTRLLSDRKRTPTAGRLRRIPDLARRQGNLAREQAERLQPYARAARDNAAEQVTRARHQAAPLLETAAHRVEDTVAPRVAEALSATAQRVQPPEPDPATRRRVWLKRSVITLGVTALGAAAAYGAYRLRRKAQDAEWQENLDRVREQVRETKEKVAAKAKGQTTAEDTEAAESGELNGRVPG